MNDGKIHIPSRKKQYATTVQSRILRVPTDAYNAIVEIYNDSTLSMGQIAGKIILGSMDRIVFDKED